MDEESGYVNQEALMDDFFDSNTELVFQESQEAFTPEQDNAEIAKNELVPPVEEKAITETVEAEQIQVDDPFSFVAKDESGEERFDPISAMDFITRKTAAEARQPTEFKYELPPVAPPAPVQPQEAPYEESIRQVYLAGFDYLDHFLQQGYDYSQATQMARNAAQTDLQNHLHERNLNEMEKRIKSELEVKREQLTEEAEIERLRPMSTKNLYEASKHGGYRSIEDFQKALMTPGYGGDAINYLFAMQNPNKSFKSVEERASAMDKWFVKYSADKQGLQFLEEVTRARIANKVMPQIIMEARAMREKVDNSNKKANGIGKVAAINPNRPNPANKTPNALDQFLGGIDEV